MSLDEQIVAMIALAKSDRQAKGALLELVRPYLLEISNSELAPDLKVKIAASDLVQDSLVEAIQDFERFGGTTAAEFFAWVRIILLHNLKNWDRWFRRTNKRNLRRERAIDFADSRVVAVLAQENELVQGVQFERGEAIGALFQSLAELPLECQQVIELRYWRELSFEEIGACTKRTPEAARKACSRAVGKLQELMGRQ